MRGTLVTSRILRYRKVIPLAKCWKRDLLFCAKYFSPFASKAGLERRKIERNRKRKRQREREREERERQRGEGAATC